MRKPDPITPEAKEAEEQNAEKAREVKVGLDLEAKQNGDLLNAKISAQQEVGWLRSHLKNLVPNLSQYYRNMSEEQLKAKDKELELQRSKL
jgi:hypothetical protein